MMELKPDRTIRYYNLYLLPESLLPGNNYNYIKSHKDIKYTHQLSATLDAFTHWAYEVTDGFLVVGNLQGYETEEQYILSDPTIDCKEELFVKANLGVEKYLSNHVCSDICRAMRLKRKKYIRVRDKLRRSWSMREKTPTERKKGPMENLSQRSLRNMRSPAIVNRMVSKEVSSSQERSITRESSRTENVNICLREKKSHPRNISNRAAIDFSFPKNFLRRTRSMRT